MYKCRILRYIFILLLVLSGCTSNSKRAAQNSTNDLPSKHKQVSSLKSREVKTVTSTDPETLKIISWNIQDLGQSKNDEEIDFIVQILRDFDIVAIQEVVAKHPAGAQKVAQIADELNRTGSKWDYRISHPTKSPSSYMSERYAFIWKTNKLALQGRAYLDEKLAASIIREPFIANFRSMVNNKLFTLVNFHSRKYNQNPELEIRHFNNYQERLNTNRLIIAGDFNLDETHPVWNEMYRQGFEAAVKNSKTTLKTKCKKGNYLSHPIDNIYYSNQIKRTTSGVYNYIESCEYLTAARKISDHLPVYLEFLIPN